MMIHKTLDRELVKTLMEQHPDLRRTTNRYEKAFHPLKSGTSAVSKMAQSIRAIALFVFTLGIYHCHVRSNTNRQWKALLCAIAKNALLATQSKVQNIQKMEDQLHKALKDAAEFLTTAQGKDQKIEQLELKLQKMQKESAAFSNAAQQIKLLQDEKAQEMRLNNNLRITVAQQTGAYNSMKAEAEKLRNELVETKKNNQEHLNTISLSKQTIIKLTQQVKDLQAQPEREPPSNPDDHIPPQEPPTPLVPVHNYVYVKRAHKEKPKVSDWQMTLDHSLSEINNHLTKISQRAYEAEAASIYTENDALLSLSEDLKIYDKYLKNLKKQEPSDPLQKELLSKLVSIMKLFYRVNQKCNEVEDLIQTSQKRSVKSKQYVLNYA